MPTFCLFKIRNKRSRKSTSKIPWQRQADYDGTSNSLVKSKPLDSGKENDLQLGLRWNERIVICMNKWGDDFHNNKNVCTLSSSVKWMQSISVSNMKIFFPLQTISSCEQYTGNSSKVYNWEPSGTHPEKPWIHYHTQLISKYLILAACFLRKENFLSVYYFFTFLSIQ